jgi:4-hydroxy-3-methylbut-2-enyl diphosphate reductase
MEVCKARVLGFCMGVRRAVEMAYGELGASSLSTALNDPSGASSSSSVSASAAAGRVYTMGPLIHHPQVLDDLQKRGVGILDENNLPQYLNGAVVIIRAHGISPVLEAELVSRGARLLDATCPKVKASQMKAQALSRAGCRIFLAGEEFHGEVIGIMGYAPSCIVVANPAEASAEAERLSNAPPSGGPAGKTILIGQTTISQGEYRARGEGIRAFFPRLEVIDTICGAARDRQEALAELCGQVDAVVVAGGRESSNTRRLLAIARGLSKPAWLAESASDLPPEIYAFKRAGLSAGASTPDQVIAGIEQALKAPSR